MVHIHGCRCGLVGTEISMGLAGDMRDRRLVFQVVGVVGRGYESNWIYPIRGKRRGA